MESKRYFRCISTDAIRVGNWSSQFKVGEVYELEVEDEFGFIALNSDFSKVSKYCLWVDPECFEEVYYE